MSSWTGASTALTVAGAAMVLGLLFAEWRDSAPMRALFKCLAASGFLAIGMLRYFSPANTADGEAVRALHLAALALSCVGDVCLLSPAPRPFIAGLGAFLLAHLAYAASFLGRGVDVGTMEASGIALLLVALLVVRWHWDGAGPMRLPVIFYALAISLMVAAALGHHQLTPRPAGASAIAVGALAFFVSDLAVARDQFIVRSVRNRLWGLPLYFAAQYVLALQL